MGFTISFSINKIKAVTTTKANTLEHFKWLILKLIKNNSEASFIFINNFPIDKTFSIMEL